MVLKAVEIFRRKLQPDIDFCNTATYYGKLNCLLPSDNSFTLTMQAVTFSCILLECTWFPAMETPSLETLLPATLLLLTFGTTTGEKASLSTFIRARGWRVVTLVMPDCRRGGREAASLRRGALRDLALNCLSLVDIASGHHGQHSEGVLALVGDDNDLQDYIGILEVVRSHSLVMVAEGRELSEEELDLFRAADISSAFYLAEVRDGGGMAFWLVHTLKNEQRSVMMPISFSKTHLDGGKDVPLMKFKYDMQGARLFCNSITFMPYHVVEKCNNEFKNCHVYGPYADIWKELEERYNFTTQVNMLLIVAKMLKMTRMIQLSGGSRGHRRMGSPARSRILV